MSEKKPDQLEKKQPGNENSLSEAEKFLESLNLPDSQPQDAAGAEKPASTADHKDIMSFLDEIAQYPSEQQPAKSGNTETNASKDTANAPSAEQPASSTWMAWGNSLWNQASAAVKTTTEQINKSVDSPAAKLLEDRVKHLQGLVNKENLGKLSNELRNLTTSILETVAPPISEHELVEVFLSHDMIGYVGLESLVYRAFARVMEQTESGHVVVRKVGDKEDEQPESRNLNMCEGMLEGTKLAKANIDHLIKLHYTPPEARTEYTPQSGAVPVINCPVFLSIQPVKFAVPGDEDDTKESQLVYVILLVDPTHQLKFRTYSQAMPLPWLDVPYEESEWVEDKMAEVIRMAVTTVAQDYVWTRMTGAKTQLAQAVAASKADDSKDSKQDQGTPEGKTEPGKSSPSKS